MTIRKLRIVAVQVQPVLVWDDGETLSPAPAVTPLTVVETELPTLAEKILKSVADLEASSAVIPED
jgi:hypothetical protein